jgi:putative component of membrane protein insertase Oxa1/YidC/SpoIIIJ protein YidD
MESLFLNMKHFTFLLIIFISFHLFAQKEQNNLNAPLLEKTFSYYSLDNVPHKKIISFKNKKVITLINPLNYLAAGLLFFYQSILSEQIQADCTYEISCSNYTKLCINEDGFIVGSLKGLHQLSTCFPANIDDCPNYKISSNLKIKNQVEPD